jgi:hypothetical protein
MPNLKNKMAFYVIDLLVFFFLVVLMAINWHRDFFTIIEHSGYQTINRRNGYYFFSPLLILLLISFGQYSLLRRNKLKAASLHQETFDEYDERDHEEKNNLYRKFLSFNSRLLFFLVGLIALFPRQQVSSYTFGIIICLYFIIRDIIMISYTVRRERL